MLLCDWLFVTSLRDNKYSSIPSSVWVTLVTSSLSPLDHSLVILLIYPELLHHSLTFPYFFLGDLICLHYSSHWLSTALLYSPICSQISALISRITSGVEKRSMMSWKAAVAPSRQVLHNWDVAALTNLDNSAFSSTAFLTFPLSS